MARVKRQDLLASSLTNSLRWSRSNNLATTVFVTHVQRRIRYRSALDIAICQRISSARQACSVLVRMSAVCVCRHVPGRSVDIIACLFLSSHVTHIRYVLCPSLQLPVRIITCDAARFYGLIFFLIYVIWISAKKEIGQRRCIFWLF